ncbi:hypothetical protein P7C73_g3674, partial [Tremellales sp. Uapishka_1]
MFTDEDHFAQHPLLPQPHYGYASMQDILPLPQTLPTNEYHFHQQSPIDLTQSPPAYVTPLVRSSKVDHHFSTTNAQAGPSTQRQPSPPIREDSPFNLQLRTNQPSIPGPPLSIRIAPGQKRPIVPPITKNTAIKKHGDTSQQHDSSSIGRVSPLPAKVAGKRKAADPSVVNMAIIRQTLTTSALDIGKPGGLFKYLRSKPVNGDIQPPAFVPNKRELTEILVTLRDKASIGYLGMIGDDDRYVALFKSWMKMFAKDVPGWDTAVAPVLQVLSKIDMPANFVDDLKIGKVAKTMADRAIDQGLPNKEEIRLAFEKYSQYALALWKAGRQGTYKLSESAQDGDSASKKRRMDGDGTDAKDVKPTLPKNHIQPSSSSSTSRPAASSSTSRPAASSSTSRPVASTSAAKPSTSSTSTARPPVKPATADMSFFGASPPSASAPLKAKPKTPLPDVKPTSSSSLLSHTMALLKAKIEPPTAFTSNTAAVESKNEKPSVKLNKKGTSVRFKDESLVMVKYFTEGAWEHETPPWQDDVGVHGLSTHQLDIGEGKALHIHEGLEETIDWYEPGLYYEPETEPETTTETLYQEQREKGILTVSYMPGEVPPCADERDVKNVDDSHETVRIPGLSGHVFAHPAVAAIVPPAAAPVPILGSLSDLLSSIGSSGVLAGVPQSQPPFQTQPEYGAYQGYYQPPAQHGHYAPLQAQYAAPPPPPQPQHTSNWGSTNLYARDYGAYSEQERDRSRVPNYKTRVCKHWKLGT